MNNQSICSLECLLASCLCQLSWRDSTLTTEVVTESIPVRFFVPSPKASLYPVSSLHHLNTTSVYSVDQEITGEAISKPKYTGNTINNRLQPDYTTSVSSKNTICNILLQRTCSTDFGEDFWKYNMGTVSVDWRCCTTTRGRNETSQRKDRQQSKKARGQQPRIDRQKSKREPAPMELDGKGPSTSSDVDNGKIESSFGRTADILELTCQRRVMQSKRTRRTAGFLTLAATASARS